MHARVEHPAAERRAPGRGPAPTLPARETLPEANRLRRPDDPSRPRPGPPPAATPRRALLRVGATPFSARWLVSVVAAVLRCAGWPDETRDDVTLAVDEAVQNAVEHGSAPAAPVEVELVLTHDAADITVRDRGIPHAGAPTGSPSPPQNTSVRGRGRVIIASLADEAVWEPSDDGTEVRLRFERDGQR